MPVFKVEISLSDGGTETVEVNAPDETEAEKVALTLIRSKDNPQTDREDLVKKITKISDKDFEMDENQLRKWAGLPERRIDSEFNPRNSESEKILMDEGRLRKLSNLPRPDYLEEAANETSDEVYDPREDEKVKFFHESLQKVFGLVFKKTKDRSYWKFTFIQKGMDLGRTTLRVDPDGKWGDSIFGESSGLFMALDADKGRERVTAAYERKFGQGGKPGRMTMTQMKRALDRGDYAKGK